MKEKLCDWLVCGISDDKIQHRLLSYKALILKDIIVGMESADKYADNLKPPGTVNPIHVVKGQPQKFEMLCYRCGEKQKATVCLFKEAECHAYWKVPHSKGLPD